MKGKGGRGRAGVVRVSVITLLPLPSSTMNYPLLSSPLIPLQESTDEVLSALTLICSIPQFLAGRPNFFVYSLLL
ncbi:hypothetical protein IE53DRAFT_388608 [Violaceomyces palustris]|uniref:Uncharacterized protein n=1 Tax=Violaceomyces palustris TaxID=1673888 RepID=A0ACD0NTQ1_9BASI|nr:hypothetical protein IE53DRAFT_388608 [Violaceomyces palustris]